MKEHFVDHRFGADAMRLIDRCNDILDEYEKDGYDLSLRQLYYQLIKANVMPNNERSYSRLGDVISDARLAGLVDWDMIKDRGRTAESNSHWSGPAEILEQAAASYRADLWSDQTTYVEVMVEKQALEGVLLPVCQKLDVTFTANKGYSSSSCMYEAGKRLAEKAANGYVDDDGNPSYGEAEAAGEERKLVVLYLGDHDPSGIDMSRDVKERLEQFSRCPVRVKRIALNMDQVTSLGLPPNPAKMTDSRAADYVARFGNESWELDAIAPRHLAKLVNDAVESVRDSLRWARAVAKQESERKTVLKVAADFRKGTLK